ncbi:TolB family protein, partial [Inquilinus sp. CA228]|uniref:TolB family protein n=1 Tax=Inquilinus sp. CA228 TaxID=3455609 RepID=UPI003F8CF8E2
MVAINTSAVARISLSDGGIPGNNGSFVPALSADGRFVVFESNASNLVAGDSNGVADIFLRDTLTGATTRLSAAGDGTEGNSGSFRALVSADGRFVVFESFASNLVAGDSNNVRDIFLRDTLTGAITLVSAAGDGTQGNSVSLAAQVSADGRFVVFESYASNLVAGDSNGVSDIYLRDTLTGTTTRLSVGLGGAQANGSSFSAAISADGRFVTFSSFASNLVAGDTNGATDVFRVSLAASGAADWMVGSDGNDAISGLGGSDILAGGLGDDLLGGGTGADTLDL